MKLAGKLAGKLGGSHLPLAPDAEVIRALAGLLSETGLTEIEYAVGDHRIRVAREAVPAKSVNGHAPSSPPPPAPAAPSEPAGAAPAVNGAAHPGAVTSPIVGVAYLASEPGGAPFVRPGDRVSEGQTLLIIEAMKVMNQIRAPRAGRIAQVFVGDSEPVEYGATLMLIE